MVAQTWRRPWGAYLCVSACVCFHQSGELLSRCGNVISNKKRCYWFQMPLQTIRVNNNLYERKWWWSEWKFTKYFLKEKVEVRAVLHYLYHSYYSLAAYPLVPAPKYQKYLSAILFPSKWICLHENLKVCINVSIYKSVAGYVLPSLLRNEPVWSYYTSEMMNSTHILKM